MTKELSLNTRLLAWFWLTTLAATFLFTAVQLVSEYQTERAKALEQIDNIRKNHLPSIAKGVWDYNRNYIQLQMDSLRNLPYVASITLEADEDLEHKYLSATRSDHLKQYDIPLHYNGSEIGKLVVGLDMELIRRNLLFKALMVFCTQALKTFIICLLLIWIFNRLILVHVLKISNYLKNFRIDDDSTLTLDRSDSRADELSVLADSINSLKRDLSKANRRLLDFNQELEAMVQDRTAQLDIERARTVQASKLASLGEMAGGIAHEINNPLAIISSSMKLLKKLSDRGKLTPEEMKSIITDVEDTVSRVTKIINGLRTVSRQSTEFIKEEVPLKDLLQDVLGLCSEKFKLHEVKLKVDVSETRQNQLILCDRVQLSQVLINLLGNAFDAVEGLEEKWVRIESELEDTDIIRITDSGGGIPPEIVEKIFNPFFTSKEVGKGTGLGLSVSKGIIHKHGGTLEVDQSQKHTCFVIKLPRS